MLFSESHFLQKNVVFLQKKYDFFGDAKTSEFKCKTKNTLEKYHIKSRFFDHFGGPPGQNWGPKSKFCFQHFFCLGLRYWFLQNHKHYQKSDGGDRFYIFRTFRGPAHFWGPKSKICSQHFFTPKWGYMLMKLLFHNFKIGGGDRFLNFGLFRALDPN